jgi:DNA polymerase-1
LLQSYATAIEREAVNHTIQATNADATKFALILIDGELRSRGYDLSITYPVLTVHDEIVVQCPQEYADDVAFIVTQCMVEGSRMVGLVDVPTVVEAAVGPSWCK